MKKVGVATLIIGILSVVTCFSIGFADWTIPVSRVSVDNGTIKTDQHTSTAVSYNEFITIDSASTIGYQVGRGFNDPITSEYVSTVNITVSGVFHKKDAIDKGAIYSIIGDNRVSFNIALSISNIPTIISNFNVDNFLINSDYFYNMTSVTGVVKTATNVYKKWNIGQIGNYADITFSVTFNVTFVGAVSSFPDLVNNKLTVSILPGEYVL